MCKGRSCGLLRWKWNGIYMKSHIVGETPLVVLSLIFRERSFISSRKVVTQVCGLFWDTIKGWSSKRYNHLSYMHNEETKLEHITTLMMVVTRVDIDIVSIIIVIIINIHDYINVNINIIGIIIISS